MLDLLKVPMDAADARLDLQLRKRRHVAYVDVEDPKVGMNINTPEDFEKKINSCSPTLRVLSW